MVSYALTLLLALAAADDKGPLAVNLTTSTAAERIPLEPLRGTIELVSDPYAGRIELRTPRPQPALAAEVSRHTGRICPTVKLVGAVIELTCRTRRFEATLTREGKKSYLDIQELRGLPWREGLAGPPFYHYEPFRTGLGSVCPGANAVSRGECALLRGKQLDAATQFRSAVDTGDGQMAALRLGDLALGTGDPATAIGWYRRAGTAGIFGRMARARICELDGNCLETTVTMKRVLDPRGLPDPLRAEMTVRAVRAEALEGRLGSATRILWQMIRGGSLAWLCREGGEVVCRRVLLQYMREAATAPVPAELLEARAAEEDAATSRALAPVAAAAPLAKPGTVASGTAAPGPAAPTASASASATPAAPTSAAAAKTPAVAVAPAPAPAAAKGPVASGEHSAPSPDVGAPVAARSSAAKEAPTAEHAPAPAPQPSLPQPSVRDDGAVERSEPEMAIEVYLSLPAWDHGPLAPELSEAAAELASHLGAPVFGGHILAAVAPVVGPAMLPAHLLKAAELYLDGDDIARTRLIIEYARTRIGKRLATRWSALEKKLAARVASEEAAANEPPLKNIVDVAEVSREIAAARAASTRAQLARAETAPKKQGDQP